MDANEKALTLFTTRVRQMILQYEEKKKEVSNLRELIKKSEENINVLGKKLIQLQNDYNSLKIAKMVEKEFNVTVTDVRTLVRKGKKTKFSKGKHAYPGITYRQDKKYAYVKLKKGDSIKVFEDSDSNESKKSKEPSAKDAVVAKTTKKADKDAGKEKK